MFDIEVLSRFYDDLSAPDGIHLTDFHKRLATLFANDRSTNDIDDYRLGKKPWKNVKDEIMPVSRFIKFNQIETDRIRFPFDNTAPDCWLLNASGKYRGIEVTIERGRERYHLAKEMIAKSTGRGFIGVQDDAPQTDFDLRMSNPRSMYSTEQALSATKAGILRCLSRKNNSKYDGVFYLLIQAHLTNLPKQHWLTITEELSKTAVNLPFKEVHVIGDAGTAPWGFQIK